jgi:hypothetical protein
MWYCVTSLETDYAHERGLEWELLAMGSVVDQF